MPHFEFRALCALLALCALPSSAAAYPFMVRHGYTGCAQCHVDPSGGGVLTPYGRAMGDVILRTRYPFDTEDTLEPSSTAGFLWGTAPDLGPVLAQGDLRVSRLYRQVEGTDWQSDTIWMRADLLAAVVWRCLRATASIGYAHEGALGAAITRDVAPNLVSREHWAGCGFGEADEWLVRAGRMNVPFGLRNIEHTLWVRSLTETDINDDQQHGVSVSYSGELFRAELMAILGNLQLRPDDFRERGYSGYIEWTSLQQVTFGASSLVAHRDLDPQLRVPQWRQAHGVFSRWATPWHPLVLMAEANYVVESPRYVPRRKGVVGVLQADLELIQGVHGMLTGELHDVGFEGAPFSYAGWLSAWWFFAPHADLRADLTYQNIGSSANDTGVWLALLMAHVYL